MDTDEVYGITIEKLEQLCTKAFNYLRKNKHINIGFYECWWFIPNKSYRGNLHIKYYDPKGNLEEITRSIDILDPTKKLGVDVVGNIKDVKDQETKIILRIAYIFWMRYDR